DWSSDVLFRSTFTEVNAGEGYQVQVVFTSGRPVGERCLTEIESGDNPFPPKVLGIEPNRFLPFKTEFGLLYRPLILVGDLHIPFERHRHEVFGFRIGRIQSHKTWTDRRLGLRAADVFPMLAPVVDALGPRRDRVRAQP